MFMPMMDVGEVRVRMGQRLMPVWVAMLRSRHDGHVVFMLVMLVMRVLVVVFQRLVRVRMLVMFGQMQPDAESHESAGDEERYRDRIAQGDGERSPKKGSD